MNYYVWTDGYDCIGLVKADNKNEAEHKVIMSHGRCSNIDILRDEDFDNYDVTILV